MKATNVIPAREYPCIEEGNNSFPEGMYEIESVEISDKPYSFISRHTILGASLVLKFIEEELASYACAVSSPISGYRHIEFSQNSKFIISWDPDLLGSMPYFTPMVVMRKEQKITLEPTIHGVHPNWAGVEVLFPKGAYLALGQVHTLNAPGAVGLITIHSAENLPKGTFRTAVSSDTDFGFDIYCHPDLYRVLTSFNPLDSRKADIMTGVVQSCLAYLQRNYGIDGNNGDEKKWAPFPELDDLSRTLSDKGCGHWSDEDFRPEYAASILYPFAPFADHGDPEDD